MSKFKFYLKDPKSEKTTSIMMVCQWANQQVKIYTGKTILPQWWNSKDGKVRNVAEFPESRKLNAFLVTKEQQAKNLYWDMELKLNRPPTRPEYKEALRTMIETGKLNWEKKQERDEMTYEEFVKKQCGIILASSNSEGKSEFKNSNVNSHFHSLVVLREFRGSSRPMRFEDFTMDFYKDFLHFCTVHKQFKPNTIMLLLTRYKTMLKCAFGEGIHSNLEYQKFKKPSDQTDSVYLNTSELDQLMAVEFKSSEKRIEIARDLFIVACWTGLRYSDWGKLGQMDFSGQVFSILTRKTKQLVTLPVFPIIRKIHEKYEGEFPKPNITLGTLNEDIRTAAKKAGITELVSHTETKGGKTVTQLVPKYERISSHTARRSFATNLYNMGVPPMDIMKLTGHRTEIAFMRYLRISSSEAAMRILDIFNLQTEKAASI